MIFARCVYLLNVGLCVAVFIASLNGYQPSAGMSLVAALGWFAAAIGPSRVMREVEGE